MGGRGVEAASRTHVARRTPVVAAVVGLDVGDGPGDRDRGRFRHWSHDRGGRPSRAHPRGVGCAGRRTRRRRVRARGRLARVLAAWLRARGSARRRVVAGRRGDAGRGRPRRGGVDGAARRSRRPRARRDGAGRLPGGRAPERRGHARRAAPAIASTCWRHSTSATAEQGVVEAAVVRGGVRTPKCSRLRRARSPSRCKPTTRRASRSRSAKAAVTFALRGPGVATERSLSQMIARPAMTR